MCCFLIVQSVKDYESGFYKVLRMTGISHRVYWLPHVAFDFIFSMVMLIPMFITVNVQYLVYSDSLISSFYFFFMQIWL